MNQRVWPRILRMTASLVVGLGVTLTHLEQAQAEPAVLAPAPVTSPRPSAPPSPASGGSQQGPSAPGAQAPSSSPPAAPKESSSPFPATSPKGPTASPSPGSSPTPGTPSGPVTQAEKQAILAMIRELYGAYQRADVDAVMKLEGEAVEASARDAEQRKTYTAAQVRDAFRECHRDVLLHKNFAMKPLHLDDLHFVRRGTQIVVRSDIPVIATEKVHLKESDMDVRLTISRFLFEKRGDVYRIVQMNLL